MRAGPALACGIVIGTAFAALMGFGFLRLWSPAARTAAQQSGAAPMEQPSTDRAVAPSRPGTASATPSRPWYGPRVDEPRPIYRCKVDGRTTYSNDSCAGGDLVPGTSAVVGFDTRPSERLARLVAAGRESNAGEVPPATRIAAPALGTEHSNCANWRQQIAAIDRWLLAPHDLRTLDDARQRRQEIRTSMTHEHC